jgi:hypothetical protein
MQMNRDNPTKSFITMGFWLAAANNIVGVLVVSKLFTNALLTSLDPAVFSWLGLVSIMLWGLAYLSVSKAYQFVPYLILVFFVEKMIYTATWLIWLSKNAGSRASIYSESPLTATFYSLYGAGDFAFGVFFLWVAIKNLRNIND